MASLPTRRRYKFTNAPVVTTLATSLDSSATTFTLASGTNWPASTGTNFWVTIGAGTATEERILCSGTAGSTVTVASSGRGQDGTTATTHNAGDSVWVSWSATDADEANAHVSASASTSDVNVHGLAIGSSVVGTSDTQTLTNKTISGSSNTFTSIAKTSVTGTAVTLADTGTVTSTMLDTTLTGKTLAGTTTNSGTISGGTVNATTLQHNSKTLPLAFSSGVISVTGNGSSTASTSITFPSSRFTQIPVVVADTGNSDYIATVGNLTSTGCDIGVKYSGGSFTNSVTVRVFAIQQTSSAYVAGTMQ